MSGPLAPYAAGAETSRGRRHPEAEHGYRSAYQRDRDRIVHSTAFRRLTYKTQVFVNHEGDHYRTRLTHTLEVAQIARTIARALGLNEDLTEVVALAHDLGHTPFGHSGEEALDDLMKGHGGFEHNRHGLRVVDVLEKRYAAFDGLNLTYEVREAFVRHRTAYDRPAPAPGEFPAGEEVHLEGQVVSAADAIAYGSHDLDDGLSSGLVREEDLRGLALWMRAARAAEGAGAAGTAECLRDTPLGSTTSLRAKGASAGGALSPPRGEVGSTTLSPPSGEVGSTTLSPPRGEVGSTTLSPPRGEVGSTTLSPPSGDVDAQLRQRATVRRLIDHQVTDVVEASARAIAESGVESLRDVRRSGRRLIASSSAIEAEKKEIQAFLYERLYRHRRVMREAARGADCVRALFEGFMDRDGDLPADFRARIGRDGRERVVCDYIAGMTDRFAHDTYGRLFGGGRT